MNFSQDRLAQYLLEPEAQSLLDGFECIALDVKFSLLDKIDIKKSGIYLWLMRWTPHNAPQELQYKLYIGRTNNFAKRMRDYTNPFQPHSANDFKFQVFQNKVIPKLFEGAKLDLYFCECEAKAEEETRYIKALTPLMNNLVKPNNEDKSKLEEAYAAYYADSIICTLR